MREPYNLFVEHKNGHLFRKQKSYINNRNHIPITEGTD